MLRPATVRVSESTGVARSRVLTLERLEKSSSQNASRIERGRDGPPGAAQRGKQRPGCAGVAVGSWLVPRYTRPDGEQTYEHSPKISPGSLSSTSDGTTFPHKEDTCAEMRAESVAARLHMPARPPLTTQLAPLCRT